MERPVRSRPDTSGVVRNPCTRLKIVSMGDASVGKSCIIKRYCEERFISKYISTIGLDYGVKRVSFPEWGPPATDLRINFWDLSGHPDFFEVRNEFYKDSQGILLVFDVGNRKSFESLDSWLEEAQRYGAKDLALVLCANKCDAPKRVVSEKEAKSWATAHSCTYWETSASSGENVKPMFESLFRDALRKTGALS